MSSRRGGRIEEAAINAGFCFVGGHRSAQAESHCGVHFAEAGLQIPTLH